MSADRHLATLLRSLHTVDVEQDTARLFPTAASLLVSLNNPLNVTLLTSQLLSAPAIWNQPPDDGLRTPLAIFGIFHSAAAALGQEQVQAWPDTLPPRSRLSSEVWTGAVLKGADSRSPRWRHLLAICGTFAGYNSHQRELMPIGLKHDLEAAIVRATNLSLSDIEKESTAAGSIALSITYVFDAISEASRLDFDYDGLLPLLTSMLFFSSEGFQSGYFIGVVNSGLVKVASSKLTWLPGSASFAQIQRLTASPLLSNAGGLTRGIAACIIYARDPSLIYRISEELVSFSKILLEQWKENKLSELDWSEEEDLLQAEATKISLPLLWNLLKMAMLSSVAVLKAILDRTLQDRSILIGTGPQEIAINALRTMRHLFFISTRFGPNAFTINNFVFLAAIDIISASHSLAEQFLQEIRPTDPGQIPLHPLDVCFDQFFFNAAEHLAMNLSSSFTNGTLIPAISPYLTPVPKPSMLESFESAHSVMLSVLGCPQNASLAVNELPSYIDTLFAVFPTSISDRQFRYAFKMLVSITSPPSTIYDYMPDTPTILLEILFHRALSAPNMPVKFIRPTYRQQEETILPQLSEQSHLILAMLDALPHLPINLLEEWLPRAAELLNHIENNEMRETCRDHFWQILSGGEMDVERSRSCVSWWNSRGGQEAVLFGHAVKDTEISTSNAADMAAR